MLGRYATPLLAPPTTAANAELHSRGARQASLTGSGHLGPGRGPVWWDGLFSPVL